MDWSPPGTSVHGIGKNTEVGCHVLLQGIFLTQESNLCLLHCRQILYHLSHQESSQLILTHSSAPYVVGQSLPTVDSKACGLGRVWKFAEKTGLPSAEACSWLSEFPLLRCFQRCIPYLVSLWIVINVISFYSYLLNLYSSANICFSNTPDLSKSFPSLCLLSI